MQHAKLEREARAMEPIRFRTQIHPWNPDKASGLAVADVPADLIPAFAGLSRREDECRPTKRPRAETRAIPSGRA